ncbi:MAG: cytochrome c oxidase accessory protein CcoG [Myxococcales bacterium]
MTRRLPILGEPGSSTALKRDGKRDFIVPADVAGRFTWRRRVVFALLIAVYVATPWIQLNGHPLVFLDLEHRAFYLFGGTFNAQDVWLVFFLLSGLGFLLILATALWGRVWCGYACPQTVFMEGVFRRIERFVEGPRNLHLRRDAGPWSLDRVARKTLKHVLFGLMAVLIAHAFLSYFVSWPGLLRMVRGAPSQHPEAFAWAFCTSLILYLNFAWFREQLCLIVCPYGRLQSVLTDQDTLVIGYDAQRGEPRGKAAQHPAACVDCGRCVVVCPTGIDIRNGLQLDCIGCAACIDACDTVMEHLKQPRGLIRYDSGNGLAGAPKRFWRPRLHLYLALGAVGLVVAALSASSREPFEANLLRLPGAPFVLEADGHQVRDALELHLVNKGPQTERFEVRGVGDPDLRFVVAQPQLSLPSLGERRVPIFVSGPNDRKPRRIRLEVRAGDGVRSAEAAFLAPR